MTSPPLTSIVRIAIACAVLGAAGCQFFDPEEAGPDASQGVACAAAEDCRDPYVCAAGACQPEAATGLGGPCWANRDCEPGHYCSAEGYCGPAGDGEVGDRCGTGGECRDELRCELDGLAGTCQPGGEADVGGGCTDDLDCLPGLVCGGEGRCLHPTVAYPPFEGVECAADDGSFRIHFDVPPMAAPEFFRLPFPSDVRVRDDGTLDLSDFPRPGPQALGIDFVDLYAEALSEDFRGFSPTGVVTMRLSDALDTSTASAESIHLVNITEGAAEYATESARRWSYTGDPNAYRCGNGLVIRPEIDAPLKAGHTYAAYVTTALRSASGATLEQSAEFAAMLAPERPSESELAAAWDAHAPFRAYLTDQGIDPAAVGGAAVFTVQDAAQPARALADAVAAEPAPAVSELTICDEGVSSPCEDEVRSCSPASSEFVEIHGRFEVPIFQAGDPPYAAPSDGGAIALDETGAPVRQGTQDVCFALTVPRDVQAPAEGWPVVVYAHGTGGNFTGAVRQGVAAALAGAASPTAMLSYDGVVHGDRREGSTLGPDQLMFNVGNPRAARDNHLQGAVDIMQALRIAGVPISVGDLEVALDPARAYVFGHSQGANVGAPALAVTDLTEAAVLSGAGAHLSEALLSKTSPVDSRRALERLVADELSPTHPVMVLWQTFFDPADSLTYAPLLVDAPPEGVPSKHIFMTWGPGDTFSPQPTLAAMARATGLPVVEPAIEDLDTGLVSRPVAGNRTGGDGQDRTAACFQYPADNYDGHFVSTRNSDAVADWVEFFTSAQAGTPSVE